MSHNAYVLVTAAYNEGAFIEETLRCIASQTILPAKWIIVSDGSTDRTDEIVKKHAEEHKFIELHRIVEDHPRNFAAQVNAINTGLHQLENFDYDFVGNIDADVTLQPSYFRNLLEKFRADPSLGLGGGIIYEKAKNEAFQPRRTNNLSSVAHAAQFFRRECFKDVGGSYVPLPYGGPDTFAETVARMKGWKVESFPDLAVYHHRPTGAAGGLLRSWYRQGKMDYSLGALPLFELVKLTKRIPSKPYLLGSIARLAGFSHCYLSREPRAVSHDFIAYLRKEQKLRLRSFVVRLLSPSFSL